MMFIVPDRNTELKVAQANRVGYRILIAAVIVTLVFAFTMSKSKTSFPSAVSRQETKVKADTARSQEGLKQFIHNDCPRVRRDWHDLTQEERNLFLDAFWEMYKRGYVALFFKSHSSGATHWRPSFLPWHRIFTFEFESRIRALGGRFRCFALPYWDWTRMAGKTVGSNPLWKQGLGGNGILSSADRAYLKATGKYRKHSSLKIPGGCVLNGAFGKSTGFKTTAGDCLRRLFHSGTYWYPSTEQTLYLIEQTQKYTDFLDQFTMWHAPVHDAIGDGTLASQEPLFFLIHSYVDLVWSMRSDCHGYDDITNWRTNDQIYKTSSMNSKLNFPFIDKKPWSLSYKIQLTPALVFNFPQFGIQYDVSDMWQRTRMQLSTCRFTYYHVRPPKTLPAGGVRVPDNVLSTRACKIAFADCAEKYRASLVGCEKMNPKTGFELILKRTAPKTNICSRRLTAAFRILKKTRKNFMALCHGKYDPVCPSH